MTNEEFYDRAMIAAISGLASADPEVIFNSWRNPNVTYGASETRQELLAEIITDAAAEIVSSVMSRRCDSRKTVVSIYGLIE